MMQIDLQEPLIITSATQNNTALEINRDGNAYFIKLEKTQNIELKKLAEDIIDTQEREISQMKRLLHT